MNSLSKPTRLSARRWVFLHPPAVSLAATLGLSLSFTTLTSCQPSTPPARPFSQPNPIQVSQAPPSSSNNANSNGSYEGLSLDAAKAKADQAKLRWRVTRIDGKGRPVTKDYRPQRLNFELTQGKVTRVTKG